MPKKILNEIEPRVVELYSSGLSTFKVSAKLRDEGIFVGQNWIRGVVKRHGVLRTLRESLAFRHYTCEVTCVGCHEKFETERSFAKYCSICAPTDIASRRLANYGLTDKQFSQLLEKQYNACAVCKTSFCELPIHRNKKTSIVIDHNHKTGQVRGLLCQSCNVTIGYIEKRPPGWLDEMHLYLGRAV